MSLIILKEYVTLGLYVSKSKRTEIREIFKSNKVKNEAGATVTQIFVSHERIGCTCGMVQHKYVN